MIQELDDSKQIKWHKKSAELQRFHVALWVRYRQGRDHSTDG